jgi:hypothetical protein
MNTTTLESAHEFANAVRLALSDLPADEVDDLTDGLEADLDERATDEDTPDFGDPVAYANELRAAAGLPARTVRPPDTLEAALVGGWQELVAGLRSVYSRPVITRVGQFFVSLRPVWWLVRGWALYGILTWLFNVPSLRLTLLTFVLGVGTLIVSVQFGRGRWLPKRWMRRALLVTNVVLALSTPLILLATSNAFGSEVYAAYASGQDDGMHDQTGLTSNGRAITNIYAYDASGVPLKQVQLYDQTGRPLYTVQDPSQLTSEDNNNLVPYAAKHGRGGWNVYPLGYLTVHQLDSDGNPKATAVPHPSVLQDLLVPPLAAEPTSTLPTATPTPGPTGTSTAPPTATPTPAPTSGH